MEVPSEISAGDFPTGFCTTPQACKATIYTFIGYFLVVLFVYLLAMHFTSLAPFSNGLLVMTKYIFLYGIIITTIVLFLSLVGTLNWWMSQFVWTGERFLFPLRDNKTSSWYYYFTDYVNWIVYGGAMIYFAICLVFLLVFLGLILLPGIAVIGFFIGYLFSLLGEAPCAAKIVESATNSVMESKLGGVIKPLVAASTAVSNTVTQVATNPAPAAPVAPAQGQAIPPKRVIPGIMSVFRPKAIATPKVPATP
jgi:hypothetical protein